MAVFVLAIFTDAIGKTLLPEWSKVMGIRVDYLSPTLYFLDILWFFVFVSGWKEVKISFRKYGWMLGLVVVNIAVADRGWLTAYRWLRVAEMGWMYVYLRENKKMLGEELKKVLPVWIVFESFLGLGQIIWGGSLEGMFYWLGERRFTYSSIGVAQMAVWGRGIIRAYGTFSHPNSMAGFLLVAELLWISFRNKEKAIWWWLVFWAGLVGIMVSGSRTVWGLTAVLLVFNLFGKGRRRWGFVAMFLGVFMVVLAGISSNYVVTDWLGGWDSEGMLKRWSLDIAAVRMIKFNPLLGVGVGNFLSELPKYQNQNGFYWLQPVHNIFLLVISEIGLLGLAILTRLKIRFDLRNKIYRSMVAVVAVTGMVDHYWLTLPQNSWLLVVLAVFLLR